MSETQTPKADPKTKGKTDPDVDAPAPAERPEPVGAEGSGKFDDDKGYVGFDATDLVDGKIPTDVDPNEGSTPPVLPGGHPNDPTIGRTNNTAEYNGR